MMDRLTKSCVTKQDASRVHRFRSAVGVEIEAISRPQLNRSLFIHIVGQPDWKARARQHHRIGVTREMNWAWVSGGDIAEFSRGRVQDPVKQRCELCRCRV